MATKGKAKESDIQDWITVKGQHIPVMKGESKSQAVKKRAGDNKNKKIGGTNKAKYDKVHVTTPKKKGKK